MSTVPASITAPFDRMCRPASTNPVDGKDIPVRHFGLILDWDDWEQLAIDLTEAKRDKALELGATHAFDATDPELASKVADLTGGGVDVAVELAEGG